MRRCQDFRLQNVPDSEVKQVQVQRRWRPICWSSEFHKQPLGSSGIFPLNLPKDMFSIRIRPLDLGEYMLFQKLMVDIDTFAGENRPSAA
jgi:hypothetical protein